MAETAEKLTVPQALAKLVEAARLALPVVTAAHRDARWGGYAKPANVSLATWRITAFRGESALRHALSAAEAASVED